MKTLENTINGESNHPEIMVKFYIDELRNLEIIDEEKESKGINVEHLITDIEGFSKEISGLLPEKEKRLDLDELPEYSARVNKLLPPEELLRICGEYGKKMGEGEFKKEIREAFESGKPYQAPIQTLFAGLNKQKLPSSMPLEEFVRPANNYVIAIRPKP